MPTAKKSRTGATKNIRPSKTRQRLTPAIRKTQIMDAAARLIVQQGFLPLPIEQLAEAAGSSKALIYTYFPEQETLFNTLLERELGSLLATGLDTASHVQDLDQAALLCVQIYFEHVASAGPLLHILLADRYMSRRIERRLRRLRNGVLLRLVRLGKRQLPLSKREVLAAIEMTLAIPEEAGRLVFSGELDVQVGRQLCRTLVRSSLEALRAPDAVLTGLVRAYNAA
jgi:AcrR family transcriptional regulator